MFEYKQVIVIRSDLKMGCGKKVAQGAHASILAAEKARRETPSAWQAWFSGGQRKIVCKVSGKESLFILKQKAEHANIPCAVVQDAGLTQLPPGTFTALGMGPALEDDLDPITRELKLL
ncbi:MAG: peptidyl-tRNA hydrolase Pth2 [Promethearchaeota archaeon]